MARIIRVDLDEEVPHVAYMRKTNHTQAQYIAPCKADSGTRETFACGIQNPVLWKTEYSSRNPDPTNDWNPESKFHCLEESTVWNPESRISCRIQTERNSQEFYFVLLRRDTQGNLDEETHVAHIWKTNLTQAQ